MLIDDQVRVSNIVKLSKMTYKQKIVTVFETDTAKAEIFLNTLQDVVFWLIQNFEEANLEFPLSVTKYKRIKKLFGTTDCTCDEKGFSTINTYLKDIIQNDANEEDYYNIIGEAFFGKDLKIQNHYDEIFILSLTSKYKNIGSKEVAVAFEEDSDILIMNDGGSFNCNLGSFLKDFFGDSGDFDFYGEAKQLIKKKIPHFDIQEELNKLCMKYQKKIENDYGLVYGAVMFCDFLGWKGLWKNDIEHEALKNANRLVGKIAKKFEELTNESLPLNKYFPVSTLLSISDTIALMTPMVYNIDKPKLFSLYSKIGKFILENSIEIFPLRGAFTIGEFNYTNNIMIGPAIDEAASWHELADWIGIILAPTAQFEYDITELSKRPEEIIQYEQIPLKVNKGCLRYCISWNEPKDAIINIVRKNKSLIPEIANKYINTYNFLNNKKKNEGIKDGTY